MKLLGITISIALASLTCVSDQVRARETFPSESRAIPIWQGLYLGAHGGYAEIGGNAAGEVYGGAGGIHAGYRIHQSDFVIGVEVDVTATMLSESASVSYGGVSATASASLDGLASARATFGLNMGPALVYATGGAAFGIGSIALSMSSGGYSLSASKDFSSTGFVVGGGVEAGFGTNWSGRIEGLRYSFSDVSVSGATANVDMSVNVIRAGLSWRPN